MQNIDDALLERLGAYVDGEVTPEEALAIEEMMATNPDVKRNVERLAAANRAISDDFLSHVEERPIPPQWHRLVQSQRVSRAGPRRLWTPSWPLAASLALLCLSVVLSTVSYITLKGAREFQAKIALSNEQSATTVAELSRALISSLGQSDAAAGESVPTPLDEGTTGRGQNPQHRLAMAMAQLREANDLADTTREELLQANQHLASLQAELAQATDPVRQIAAYHRLSLDTRPRAVDRPGTAQQRASVQTRLREHLGERMSVPDLDRQGLVLNAGDILLLNNRVAARLTYTDTDGELLGLWIMRASGETQVAPRQQYDDVTVIAWRDDAHHYFVAGTQPFSILSPIAKAIESEIARD